MDGPAKGLLLTRINERICYHSELGMRGLPPRCSFLFRHTLDHLQIRTVRSRVAWLSAVTSAAACCRRRTQRRKRSAALDKDSLLLSYLVEGRQLSQLAKVDSVLSLRTTIGPDRSRDHHLGREDDNPEFLHPDHDHYRDVIRIVLPS